jgi:hypothetical protein
MKNNDITSNILIISSKNGTIPWLFKSRIDKIYSNKTKYIMVNIPSLYFNLESIKNNIANKKLNNN